jgi:MoxR-like ATPase
MGALKDIQELKRRINQSIIGQDDLVERILIGILANGNVLLEGLPKQELLMLWLIKFRLS